MKINDIVNEGVGRIVPGVNTTPDVGPNEIVKQAKKLGFKVDKDGRPPLLKKSTRGSSTNVLFNLGLAESKQLQEIEKISTIKKSEVSKADLDEFLWHGAKSTGDKIKGYDLYYDKHTDSDVYLLAQPSNEEPGYEFIGILRLFNQPGGWQYSNVFLDQSAQGKGLAIELYKYAINKGHTIVSDNKQTKGSQLIWQRLAQTPGIFVYQWIGKETKPENFKQWDSTEDPDEPYYDPAELSKIENDYEASIDRIEDRYQAGKVTKQEAQAEFKQLTADVQDKIDELEQVRDVRLIATKG